jgi:hypothetical protein
MPQRSAQGDHCEHENSARLLDTLWFNLQPQFSFEPKSPLCARMTTVFDVACGPRHFCASTLDLPSLAYTTRLISLMMMNTASPGGSGASFIFHSVIHVA